MIIHNACWNRKRNLRKEYPIRYKTHSNSFSFHPSADFRGTLSFTFYADGDNVIVPPFSKILPCGWEQHNSLLLPPPSVFLPFPDRSITVWKKRIRTVEDYRSVNSAISKQTNVRASEEKTLASRLLRACAMEHRARNTVKIMKNSLANGQRAFERVFFLSFPFFFFLSWTSTKEHATHPQRRHRNRFTSQFSF